MTQVSICNNRFHLDHPLIVDPREKESWQAIDQDQLPVVLAQGFEAPVDFPPIAQAVLPGDTIAIAVEPQTPFGMEMAVLVAQRFVETGIDPENISIVLADEADATGDLAVVIHDAEDADQLAWLAADQNGVPFSVNRTLFEADLVVPVGAGDCGSQFNKLCPAFCDAETQEHLAGLTEDQVRAVARMIDSNLGVFWQVRMVTGPGEEILEVHVGLSDSVLEAASKAGRDAWTLKVDDDAGLVLATIEARCCQSWDNLRKAIFNADRVAKPDAAIAICCEVSGKPPVYWPTPDNQSRKVDQTLADIFRSRHVYLYSQLTQAATEKYGFGFLDRTEQIEKLIEQHQSCLLLRDAHRVCVEKVEKVNSDG